MRFYYRLAAVLALLFLCLSNPIPATLADSPTPTPKPRTVSAPGNGGYKVFLPLILSNGAVQTPISKKGVPLTYDNCADVTAMNATWEYDWTATPPNCPGVEYVPMIESAADMIMINTLGGNSNWIMGFNEPDLRGLSPYDAAGYWHIIENTYPTRKLLAPAPSGSTSGLNWLIQFRTEYNSRYQNWPRLDGLAAHCYKWSANDCMNFVQSFINQATAWGVPVLWVTEFSFATAAPSSPSGALQEQRTFINWMVSQPKITRYAWFASRIQGAEPWAITCYDGTKCFNNPLIDWNTGQPTTYGNTYRQSP